MKTGRIKADSTPKIGEVVLIWQEYQPRGTWRMGRILELIPSEDGKIRSAKVQLPDKKTLKRSVTQLYPLECHLDQENLDMDNGFGPEVGVSLGESYQGEPSSDPLLSQPAQEEARMKNLDEDTEERKRVEALMKNQELSRHGRKAKVNAKKKISKLFGGSVAALP